MKRKYILDKLALRNYMSELEIPNQYNDYGSIRSELDRLVSDGEVYEVGELYSERYGKLFKYYTSSKKDVLKYRQRIEKRQFKGQYKMLIERLIKQHDEHSGIQATKAEYELLINGSGKIDLKFHQLGKVAVCKIYSDAIDVNKRGGLISVDGLLPVELV